MQLDSDNKMEAFEYYDIRTEFSKESDTPVVQNFEVKCCKRIADNNESKIVLTIGSLKGFVVRTEHLPTDIERGGWLFDVFDERDNHSADAFEILTENLATVATALEIDDSQLDYSFGLLMLERALIHPDHRGKGMALRLMREAKQILNRFGLIVILKAHPDGDQISSEACIRLADYYCSDDALAFVHFSQETKPGWLIGKWDEFELSPDDGLFWEI